MATTVEFEHVVNEATASAELLGDNVEEVLPEYAPSIICKFADDVELIVPSAHPLWNDDLKDTLTHQVTGHVHDDGTPRQIKYIMI